MTAGSTHPLYERFRQAWLAVGGRDPERAWQCLAGRYREPHRVYHDLHHLERIFAAKDEVIPEVALSPELTLAVFFHDIVFAPGARDNEVRSAELAATMLADAPPAVRRRVAHLVNVTATHHGRDREEQLLVDLDLSGFAGSPETFDRLFEMVRAEFPDMDAESFRRNHARAVAHLLDRDPLYATPEFRAACEAQARRNINRLLASIPEPS